MDTGFALDEGEKALLEQNRRERFAAAVKEKRKILNSKIGKFTESNSEKRRKMYAQMKPTDLFSKGTLSAEDAFKFAKLGELSDGKLINKGDAVEIAVTESGVYTFSYPRDTTYAAYSNALKYRLGTKFSDIDLSPSGLRRLRRREVRDARDAARKERFEAARKQGTGEEGDDLPDEHELSRETEFLARKEKAQKNKDESRKRHKHAHKQKRRYSSDESSSSGSDSESESNRSRSVHDDRDKLADIESDVMDTDDFKNWYEKLLEQMTTEPLKDFVRDLSDNEKVRKFLRENKPTEQDGRLEDHDDKDKDSETAEDHQSVIYAPKTLSPEEAERRIKLGKYSKPFGQSK